MQLSLFHNLVMEGKKFIVNKSLKKTFKGKLKKDSADYKKEMERLRMIKELMTKTMFSQEEVLVAEKEFLISYPTGGIAKEEFLDVSSLGFISESLFKAFDKVLKTD